MRRYAIFCLILLLMLITACKLDDSVSKTVIKYNSNGGKGSMTNQYVFSGQSQRLSTNAFTKDGFSFTGWKDDDGNSYSDNAVYTYDNKVSELTLYAQWEAIGDYVIGFIDTIDYNYAHRIFGIKSGVDYTLPTIEELYERETDPYRHFKHPDNPFIEWNTKPDFSGTTYSDGAVVKDLAKPGEEILLYSRWGVEISYDKNNDKDESKLKSLVVKSGETIRVYGGFITPLDPPSAVSFSVDDQTNFIKHVFRGWCTELDKLLDCHYGYYGSYFLKENDKCEGIAPAKDTKLHAIWGYNYYLTEECLETDKIDRFCVNRSTVIQQCEQNLNAGEGDLDDLYKHLQSSSFVVLATGPLKDDDGNTVTKKFGNGRYCYAVVDETGLNYKSFSLYVGITEHSTSFVKENLDTDVLVIFNVPPFGVEPQYSFNLEVLPSKAYMSTWGNPSVGKNGNAIDPLIFRALFPNTDTDPDTPEKPARIWSSTKDSYSVGSPYYYVCTYSDAEGNFWKEAEEGSKGTEDIKMVLTALF